MNKHFKRPLSILLAVLMVIGVFVAVPTVSNAAEQMKSFALGDPTGTTYTINWVLETASESDVQTTVNDVIAAHADEIFNYVKADIEPLGLWGIPSLHFDSVRAYILDTYYSGGTTDEIDYITYKILALKDTGSTASSAASAAEGLWDSVKDSIAAKLLAGNNLLTESEVAALTPLANWIITLETDENVAEGTTPEYNSAIPTKAADDNYTYEFSGWSPAVETVSADATYIAQFTAVPKASVYDYVTDDEDGFNFSDTIAADEGDTLAAANGYTSLFNFKILGVQQKNDVDEYSSDGGKDVRFVSVINTAILKDAEEYGYVFAKFDTKQQARDHADDDAFTAHGSKVLTKVCTKTSNAISGDYGMYNEDTNYKYVTATVNGIGDDVVAARFYVKKSDTYFYADYTNDQNQTYTVCAAAYSDLA